jgi:hypothetical protein
MESLKETYLAFCENHYLLSMVLRFVIAIAAFIIVIRILGFICSLISAVLEKIVAGFDKAKTGLDKLCAPVGKSSNPWGMVFSVAFAAMFYFAPEIVKGEMKEFWVRETVAGIPMHRMWGIVIAAITALAGMSTAKTRFPQVLLAKIVRIPLDLISLPFRLGCWVTAIAAGITGFSGMGKGNTENVPPFTPGGTSGIPRRTVPRPGSVPIFIPTSSDNDSEQGYTPTSSYNPEPTQSDFSDGFSYFGDQHTDQYRTSQEGGSDGYYYGKTESGQTVYYSGEYRPYNGTGENIEYYHLDEDYAPMDND